jgi:adenine C2-methylase RlmN of 23S rRNA A2503 and tRNA A37
MSRRRKADLKLKSIWDEKQIQDLFQSQGKTMQHAFKIWNWMIAHPLVELADVPMEKFNIPRSVERALKSEFHKFTSKVVTKNVSERGDTTKLLIELQDGHKIETVVMIHSGRTTVCVSSQIGCKMGCKFCATGTMGIIGDLTSGEIIEQLVHASAITRVRNVVFMGMGEPLNNFENVKLACEFMTDNRRFGLSPRQVTVSTVGVVNAMYRLTEELPHISMALSLHAPTQDIRLKIVPAASGHPLDKLMEAVDHHISFRIGQLTRNYNQKKDMVVMMEYILIAEVNDLPEHAHLLGQLLSPRQPYILLNLIPYNPTEVNEDFKAPTQDRIDTFFRICASPPYSIYTRVRQEMGQDIDGACGQLALVHKSKEEKNRDIEDTLSQSGGQRKKEGKYTSRSSVHSTDAVEFRGAAVSSSTKRKRNLYYHALLVVVMASYHPIVNMLCGVMGVGSGSTSGSHSV